MKFSFFHVNKFFLLMFLCVLLNAPHALSSENQLESSNKDPWPLIPKDNINVALIGTYGEYRDLGHYHIAIDIQSRKGEPVINCRDGYLIECVELSKDKKRGWRIVIGDPKTLIGREYAHVEPVRKLQNMELGKSIIKKGETIGYIYDYGNDQNGWNDHLHYGYVRIKEMVNHHGRDDNLIEGLEHPLNRLEITSELLKTLRDAPPQFVEDIFFAPDEGKKEDFKGGVVFGKVDIIIHAFDRMGRGEGLGKYAPAPYEFEWRIIRPENHENDGGVLLMDGPIPFLRSAYHSNYIVDESWLGDFRIIITNGMNTNGFWFTNESMSNPGSVARSSDDARFPDGEYTIRVTIREHPSLGIPQREVYSDVKVTVDNFPD